MNPEGIIAQKNAVRKAMKEKKRALSEGKKLNDSEIIFNRVESLTQFKVAKTILAYWSLPDEVDTHRFITKWANEKRIALPVVAGDTLELRFFNGLNNLVTSDSFGIQEPIAEEVVTPEEIDLAIIPGVAFDRKGNRLGRGKGFYDRFLNQTKAYKVAVGFDFQILEEIPVASFDIPVDIVVTTKN